MASLGFLKKHPGLSTFLILEFVLLILVTYQIQVGGVSLLEKTFMTVFSPVQALSNRTLDSINESFEDKKSRAQLTAENQRLQRALQDYQQTVVTLAETELENERLRRLLDLPKEPDMCRVYAEVILANHRRDDYMLTINKGSMHGLKRDYGVITDGGVVGVIWEVSPYYSKVMTANNPASAIAAQLHDSRDAESYVAGQGSIKGSLDNFPNFKRIARNDQVLTSGLDGVFPPGIQIGRVISGTPDYMSQDVEINFAIDFSRVEELVVLIPECNEEEKPDELE